MCSQFIVLTREQDCTSPSESYPNAFRATDPTEQRLGRNARCLGDKDATISCLQQLHTLSRSFGSPAAGLHLDRHFATVAHSLARETCSPFSLESHTSPRLTVVPCFAYRAARRAIRSACCLSHERRRPRPAYARQRRGRPGQRNRVHRGPRLLQRHRVEPYPA